MPQLRWTLLFLGVLFVILLAWIERRRQKQQGFSDQHSALDAEHGGEPGPTPVFREPSLTLPEMRARDPAPPQELPVVEIEEDSLKPRRLETDELRAEPPTLSLPVLEAGPIGSKTRGGTEPTLSGIDSLNLATPTVDLADSEDEADADAALGESEEERAFNEAVFGEDAVFGEVGPDSNGNRREPHFSDDDVIAEGAVADGAPAEGISALAPPVRDPVVEWPPDDQRRVVALRLVASPPDRFPGRILRLALASEGFVLGKFQIFHKPDENGRAVLSAANLSKPGTFDLEAMDVQRYAGLSLFAVLPGPRPPLKTFDDLLATARNLNERLQGALQDERGGPLTPTRIASLRESLATEETS
jgi:hypothetical protein